MKKFLLKSLMALAIGATALTSLVSPAAAQNPIGLSYTHYDVDLGGTSTNLDGYVLNSAGAYDSGFSYTIDYTNANGSLIDYEGADFNANYLPGGGMFGIASDYRWDKINGFSDKYKGLGIGFGWNDQSVAVNASLTSDVREFGDDYAFRVNGAYGVTPDLAVTGGFDYLSKDYNKREFSVGANYALQNDFYVDAGYTYIDSESLKADQVSLGVGFNF